MDNIYLKGKAFANSTSVASTRILGANAFPLQKPQVLTVFLTDQHEINFVCSARFCLTRSQLRSIHFYRKRSRRQSRHTIVRFVCRLAYAGHHFSTTIGIRKCHHLILLLGVVVRPNHHILLVLVIKHFRRTGGGITAGRVKTGIYK